MSRRLRRWLGWAALVAGLATAGLYVAAGFLDRDPLSLFAAEGRRAPVGALYFSGDMGLRFGMGPHTARTLAAQGITVMGVSSSSAFATHRTRAELDAIVANAVRAALARTGSDRLVLIGQSFGADMLQTGLAHLPAELRRHVAAVVLVVPGDTVFFRADPSGIAYRGTPDSLAAATIDTIDWAPLTCIYGQAETDSACPAVRLPNAHVLMLPGDHFLNKDHVRLADEVLRAIHAVVPAVSAIPKKAL